MFILCGGRCGHRPLLRYRSLYECHFEVEFFISGQGSYLMMTLTGSALLSFKMCGTQEFTRKVLLVLKALQ